MVCWLWLMPFSGFPVMGLLRRAEQFDVVSRYLVSFKLRPLVIAARPLKSCQQSQWQNESHQDTPPLDTFLLDNVLMLFLDLCWSAQKVRLRWIWCCTIKVLYSYYLPSWLIREPEFRDTNTVRTQQVKHTCTLHSFQFILQGLLQVLYAITHN